jgi:hypothetical protein
LEANSQFYSISQIGSAIYADKLKKHGYISGFEPSLCFLLKGNSHHVKGIAFFIVISIGAARERFNFDSPSLIGEQLRYQL